MFRPILIALGLVLSACALHAADPLKFERVLKKEPAYQTKTPKYALLAFGPAATDRVWLVWDGDALYVDRNGDGDLTEPGERVAASKPKAGWVREEGHTFEVGDLRVGGRAHKALNILLMPVATIGRGALVGRVDASAILAKDPKALAAYLTIEVEVPGIKGGASGGRVQYLAGPVDLDGVLQFADKLASAPVVHFGGPLQVSFCADRPTMRVDRGSEFVLAVGTPGSGPGTTAYLSYEDTIPKAACPVAEITFQPAKAGDPLVKEKIVLTERCCGANFYDRVRTAAGAGPGTADVTLSFPDWREGDVASSTHNLTVLPGRPGAKVEPAEPNLMTSLVYPNRKAVVRTVAFSPDGRRLCASSDSADVVQVWDWAAKKALHTIELPPSRPRNKHVTLAPDWKTLYVPVERLSILNVERDGKGVTKVAAEGEIHSWDLTSGKENEPIRSPADTSPRGAWVSPDGRFLASQEAAGYEAGQKLRSAAVVRNLETGKLWKLDGSVDSAFSPDSQLIGVSRFDLGDPVAPPVIKLVDVASGRERAKLEGPDKDCYLTLWLFSPDGALVTAHLQGRKPGRPSEIWFRDGRTLADRGRFVGTTDPKDVSWCLGHFSPDGRYYLILEAGKKFRKLHVWDVAAGKVVRTFDVGPNAWQMAPSPDGKTVAIGWAPERDAEQADARDPDPQDLPQPRVTLFDLAGARPPRTLIAPHGRVGTVAFSPDGKTLAFGSSGAVHVFDLTK
ncbi:WD40 repeat domain-containing protein [Fimbriiglobus ruber]|uniref:WD-repeat protein n=1 Tax=Fimbriiglobus ruber TaxID=1908690 RepID=A0A225E0Y3_9BACT|nr:WD40 repeat domain-containing protein [Fimbriiglobus ruber]OWK45464.1 WD-repeat protein [Fimbriiglobus ruber]